MSRKALQFLYAYMPVADVTDYPTSFFLENVRTSFEARQQMAWGNKVPELLFRHFVLPVRINNENLDNSRMVFFKELKERVKGMGMKDAILEVNHWSARAGYLSAIRWTYFGSSFNHPFGLRPLR